MADRVKADDVRRKLDGEDGPLLVCAYEDKAKCEKTNVEPSISFDDFKSKLPSISKRREIVFFCA